jgi:glycerophosphoryl diester phosphodiesterase
MTAAIRYEPPPRLLVGAHRGASGSAPENTLAAFRRALEIGVDLVELDCQLTRDGHVVVFHDDRLERTTNGRGALRGNTLAELQACDAGAWFDVRFRGEPIPTLAEVLGLIGERAEVNVELKGAPGPADDGLERATLDVVRACGALARVLFSSFEVERLRRMRALAAAARLGVLWSRAELAPALALAAELCAVTVNLRRDRVDAAACRAVHVAGPRVWAWTANEAHEIERLARAGADGVMSDHPERVRAVAAVRSRP